jgi:hypothetical protein
VNIYGLQSYLITVKERYGKPFEQLVEPRGFEFTGEFRPVKQDEFSLAGDSACIGENALPGLILRRVRKRKRIIFEEKQRIDANQFAMPGEWLLYEDIGHRPKCCLERTEGPGTIMSRREEEF